MRDRSARHIEQHYEPSNDQPGETTMTLYLAIIKRSNELVFVWIHHKTRDDLEKWIDETWGHGHQVGGIKESIADFESFSCSQKFGHLEEDQMDEFRRLAQLAFDMGRRFPK